MLRLGRRGRNRRRLLRVMARYTLLRRVAAEMLGTALLLIAIVGSGIMADRLASANLAIELFAVSLATGATLVVLIVVLGPISGGHFNPSVTLIQSVRGQLPWANALPYVAAQVAGALLGVATANLMFGDPAFVASAHERHGPNLLLGEFVATFGLLITILGSARFRPESAALGVGAYIGAAIWFTSSTAFANPAVTVARMLTNSFTGIRPADVPGFVIVQFAGALAAAGLFTQLARESPA